ncbi:ferredoxin [Candidatus Bathyarchaeota archaeon]|nr:MAG: ferredoxin [Candidatus Bathyarchaeota archaeon]RLI22413.1 MAG: ferredoxin [Candidatus Bathyarchaeota archaeon]HDN62777.1 4Fe-4S dicluster domain-containing protein [Candidatus Bathyarchaeota archaeon]
MVVEIKIDYSRCVGCKECVKVCSFGVLEWLDDMPVVVDPNSCSFCLDCEKTCPTKAITHKES